MVNIIVKYGMFVFWSLLKQINGKTYGTSKPMFGLGLVSEKKYWKLQKKLWEFVYHIERHATNHKYNLNFNKNIMPKNQQDIKSLSI